MSSRTGGVARQVLQGLQVSSVPLPLVSASPRNPSPATPPACHSTWLCLATLALSQGLGARGSELGVTDQNQCLGESGREARHPASLGWNLASSLHPSTEGSRTGQCGRLCQPGLAMWHHALALRGRADAGTVSLVRTYHVLATSHNLEKQNCCAHFMDEGVEVKSSTYSGKISQCLLIALRMGPSTFPWVLPLPSLYICATLNSHSLSTLHSLTSSPVLGFPLTLVLPTFPYQHVCGHATSSGSPP